LLQQLVDKGTQEKITFNEEQFLQSKELIRIQIKALIASDLWGINEYYQVMNQVNDSFLKAVDLLKNPELYNRVLEKR